MVTIKSTSKKVIAKVAIPKGVQLWTANISDDAKILGIIVHPSIEKYIDRKSILEDIVNAAPKGSIYWFVTNGGHPRLVIKKSMDWDLDTPVIFNNTFTITETVTEETVVNNMRDGVETLRGIFQK